MVALVAARRVGSGELLAMRAPVGVRKVMSLILMGRVFVLVAKEVIESNVGEVGSGFPLGAVLWVRPVLIKQGGAW
jgi:hypothetical protein